MPWGGRPQPVLGGAAGRGRGGGACKPGPYLRRQKLEGGLGDLGGEAESGEWVGTLPASINSA